MAPVTKFDRAALTILVILAAVVALATAFAMTHGDLSRLKYFLN